MASEKSPSSSSSKSQEKSAPAEKDGKSGPAPAAAASAAAAAAAATTEVKSSRVFIGNLHFNTTADELRKHLEAVVPVVHAEVISYASGRSKGCGLAELKNAGDAEKVVKQLTNSDLGGRKIFIREDREPKGFGKSDSKSAPNKPSGAAAAAAAGAESHVEAKGGRGGRGRGGRRGRGRGRGRFTSDDAPPRPANNDGRNLFVGNLPWATTEAELKQLFGDFGVVTKCVIQQDRSGRSKGFATVAFAKENDAQAAILGLNDVEVGERKIVVRRDNFAN